MWLNSVIDLVSIFRLLAEMFCFTHETWGRKEEGRRGRERDGTPRVGSHPPMFEILKYTLLECSTDVNRYI